MSDKVLDRFSARLTPESILDSTAEEDVEAFTSFAILRGARERAVSVALHKKTGEAIAMPYGMIHRYEFDGSTSITMHSADGLAVKVTGRNFNAPIRPGLTLFAALSKYLVVWLAEADRARTLSDASAVVVDSISW
jgi:hypothetical protein